MPSSAATLAASYVRARYCAAPAGPCVDRLARSHHHRGAQCRAGGRSGARVRQHHGAHVLPFVGADGGRRGIAAVSDHARVYGRRHRLRARPVHRHHGPRRSRSTYVERGVQGLLRVDRHYRVAPHRRLFDPADRIQCGGKDDHPRDRLCVDDRAHHRRMRALRAACGTRAAAAIMADDRSRRPQRRGRRCCCCSRRPRSLPRTSVRSTRCSRSCSWPSSRWACRLASCSRPSASCASR